MEDEKSIDSVNWQGKQKENWITKYIINDLFH